MRCVNQQPWGQKLASISPFQDFYQPFSGLPNYSKKFYLSWCCSNFQRKSNSFPTSLQTISNQIRSPLFKTLNPSYVQMTPPPPPPPPPPV